MRKDVYYGDYLQLDKILNAQDPESDKEGIEAHDEMLFIIIHQSYELWFKQIIYELKSIHGIFSKNAINDNAPDLYKVVHRMKRIATILDVAVHQISIMETMTPLDFLDFRNLLRPASGFQSIQFKIVEAMLGLKLENRHGKEYYVSQLRDEHKEVIRKTEEHLMK
jgi:tryptophan 2,3-dioxygenase